MQYFLQSFHFGGLYQKSGDKQGILCCGFFLVGILTIELKTRKQNLEESHSGFISILLPTVGCLLENTQKNV
jgi:hypothetical protein